MPVARSGGGLQASGVSCLRGCAGQPGCGRFLVAWWCRRCASSGRWLQWSATARGPAKRSGLTSRFTGLPVAAGELYVRLLGGANLAAQKLAFVEQKMSTHRVYKSHEFMQPAEKEPIRSVVVESSHSVIVAWHVEPGQTIAPHIHPDGQDTWTILSGEGQYQIDEQGNTVAIVPGDIVVANKGQVHGVLCTSVGPLRFISVVAPLDAGYEPLSAKT